MSGLNFDVAFSGIFAAQRAIKVTQNNIANINTDGYARQKINFGENVNVGGPGIDMQIGNGVNVEEIERIKDDFLIAQSRGEKGIFNYFQSMRESMSAIETVFNENSEGSVSQLLAKFFNGWEELSKYPEENSYRNALIATSENLANKLNDVNNGLVQLESKLDNDIEFKVKKVNEIIKKIVDTNNKITRMANENPNSLLDERDRYLDELSSYVDVQVVKDIKNPLLVNVKIGGVNFVTGNEARYMETMFDTGEGKWLVTTGNTMVNLTGGTLAGDLEVRNEKVSHYKNQLNEFVSTLVSEINTAHKTGFGLNNATGNDFFEGTGIHNIKLNPLFKTSPESIATSANTDTPGNADISKTIASIKQKNIFSGGTSNPMSYYNGVAIELATETNIVSDNEKVHGNILMNIESDRYAVQGVSMDEELANLLKFEQYYAANSKVVSAVDKLFDTLLQMF